MFYPNARLEEAKHKMTHREKFSLDGFLSFSFVALSFAQERDRNHILYYIAEIYCSIYRLRCHKKKDWVDGCKCTFRIMVAFYNISFRAI